MSIDFEELYQMEHMARMEAEQRAEIAERKLAQINEGVRLLMGNIKTMERYMAKVEEIMTKKNTTESPQE